MELKGNSKKMRKGSKLFLFFFILWYNYYGDIKWM